MIRNYEDLQVYKKSYRLAIEIYKFSKKIPKDEIYGLISQLQRASLSISLNIAEGYGKRASVAEFRRFLSMAKGSCEEMKVLLDFCKDIQLIDMSIHSDLKNRYDEVGKMLYKLIEKWQ